MGEAWNISEDANDREEQQGMSKSGGIPSGEAEGDGKTVTDAGQDNADSDDRGLNQDVSDTDGSSQS